MKATNTLAHAFTLCGLLAAASGVAFAQDGFPDSPANHWAFESLTRLRKDGILVGYEDGRFRGGRPASRFEMAAAVYSAFTHLKDQEDGLSAQIGQLTSKLESGSNFSAEDLNNLKAALAAAQNDLGRIQSWTGDLADLKKLAVTFEKELTAMGVNFEAMKDDLSQLELRVDALEKKKLPLDVSGDLNFVGLGGYSESGEAGLSVDGRPTGVGRDSYDGAAVGVTRDLTILQEAAVRVASSNDEGAKFHGTVVAGDMVGKNGWVDQSTTAADVPFREGLTNVYLQDFAISFNSSLAGIPFNAEVGRVGYSIDPYILRRPDNTPYFENERWDNGAWSFDGAIVTLDYGTTKLRFFGGRNNLGSGGTTSGEALQPMQAGSDSGPFTIGVNRPRGLGSNLLTVDQSLGTNLSIPITQTGSLNLAYLWLSADTTAPVNSASANGVRVFGGDLKLRANDLSLEGGYSKSDVMSNDHALVNQDDEAYWLSVNKEGKRYGAKAGYRYIAPQFSAPGDWGRIGIWWNPTDIKGYTGDVHYNLSDTLKLTAGGEFYSGTGKPTSTLNEDDHVRRYVIGLTYRRSTRYDVSVGYEQAEWDLADRTSFTGGMPVERWYNLGLGMSLSSSARLRFMWQISDYDSRGVPGFGPFASGSSTTAKGGLLTTQLSVKF